MTRATGKEQTILDQIRSLTPQQQQEVLDFIEFLQFKARKGEIEEEKKEPISAYEAAKDLAGCIDNDEIGRVRELIKASASKR